MTPSYWLNTENGRVIERAEDWTPPGENWVQITREEYWREYERIAAEIDRLTKPEHYAE